MAPDTFRPIAGSPLSLAGSWPSALRVSGRIQPEPVDTTEATRLRDARIEAARRNPKWTEIEEVDLVRRGRLLVSATTDALFTLKRGAVYASGEVKSTFAEFTELHFYVSHDGELVFLERKSGTWTEIVERRARRRVAA